MSEILIVGAGPTGMTLACELALRQVPYRIIDASPAPFAGSRAKGLQPRTLEVFDRLGLAEEVVAAGLTELPFRQYDPEGGHRDVPRPGLGARPDVPWPSPLLIPQWRTEAALRGRLEALGGSIEYGTTLTSAVDGRGWVTATLERSGQAQEIEVAWLVGCDGGHSTVRHAAQLRFLGETDEGMRMLVGDIQVNGIDRQHWHTWRGADGAFLSMAPLAGTDNAFQIQIAIGPNARDDTSLENFQRFVDERTGRSDIRLSEPTWTSLWRANVRMVEHYRAGRMFIAGDAAHVHTPAGGQGMNTGIQDAFNLGWKLAAVQRGAGESLLDTYEAERLPVARHVLGLSNRLAATAVSAETQGMLARDEDTFQLGIRYRESPLSRELRSAPGSMQAGDRAPDARGLLDRNGGEHRLFDLFRGPRATLVAFGTAWSPQLEGLIAMAADELRAIRIVPTGTALPDKPDLDTFTDTGGHAAAAWEADADALFVVRPDGVLGFAADHSRVDDLASWLHLAGLMR